MSENPIDSVKNRFNQFDFQDFANLTNVQQHTCKESSCLKNVKEG